MATTKFILSEDEIPEAWYNIAADLPTPPVPPLNPGTKQPIGPDDLAPLFPMAIIGQEVSAERYLPIPEEVRELYRLYRPTPLFRAHRLERALDTPARIYYKYEGVSPAGSHKPRRASASCRMPSALGISTKIVGVQSINVLYIMVRRGPLWKYMSKAGRWFVRGRRLLLGRRVRRSRCRRGRWGVCWNRRVGGSRCW